MAIYKDEERSREQVVDTLRELVRRSLTSGSSGNVSVRTDVGMLVTPTGLAPGELEAASIVSMALDGEVGTNQLRPSSEWRIHADIYRAKPDVNAVVHCHSPYATILACAHR